MSQQYLPPESPVLTPPFEAFCQATEGHQNIYRDERDLDDLDPGASGKSRPPLSWQEPIKGPYPKGKVDQKTRVLIEKIPYP